MSTILEGQIVTWRSRERPGSRVVGPLLRAVAVAAATTSALLYFVTRSQTVEVVTALAREAVTRDAAPDRAAAAGATETDAGAFVVSVRPSALERRLLQP